MPKGKKIDINQLDDVLKKMSDNADPMFGDDVNLYDMVTQLPNGFMGINPDDVTRVVGKLSAFRKDMENNSSKLKGDLNKFVQGLDRIKMTMDFGPQMKDLQSVVSDFVRDISASVNRKILQTQSELDKMSKYYQRTAMVNNKSAKLTGISSASLNIKPKVSGTSKRYGIDRAGTVFGPMINNMINDPAVRKIALDRLRRAPIESFVGPASSTLLHHSPVENQRGGNAVHVGRVAMAAYGLTDSNQVPKGLMNRIKSNFYFDENDTKRGRNLSDKEKEAARFMALIHDAEKAKAGTGGPLGVKAPDYNPTHDSEAFSKLLEPEKAKLKEYFGEQIYGQMEEAFNFRDKMFSKDDHGAPVYSREKIDEMMKSNPLAWALGMSDSKAANTSNFFNPLSSLQVRAAGGMVDTRRVNQLMSGASPTNPNEAIALRDMISFNNRKEAASRLKSGDLDPVDIVTAFKGRIYDERAGGYMAPQNVLDTLSEMVDSNGDLKMSKDGYIDKKLLKTHLLDPDAMNSIIDSITRNTTMASEPKRAMVEKLTSLKNSLDQAVVRVINQTGGGSQDYGNILNQIDTMDLNDLTGNRKIVDPRAIQAVADSKKRVPSSMELEGLKQTKMRLEIDEKAADLEFYEDNKGLSSEVRRLELEDKKKRLSAVSDPKNDELRAAKDAVTLKELQTLQASGQYEELLKAKTDAKLADYQTTVRENRVSEKLGDQFFLRKAGSEQTSKELENSYNKKTLDTRVEMLEYQKDSLKIQNETKKHLAEDAGYTEDLAELRKLTVKKQIDELKDPNAALLRSKKAELELAKTSEELSKLRSSSYKQEQILARKLQLEKTKQELIDRGYKATDKGFMKDNVSARSYQDFRANELSFKKMQAQFNVENQAALMNVKKFRIAQQSSETWQKVQQLSMENRLKNLQSGGTGGFGGGGGYRGGSFGGYSASGGGNLMWQLTQMGRGLFGPMLGISSAVGLMKESYEAIRQNELALINLRRVFDGTDSDFRMLGEGMSQVAMDFGDTLESVGVIQEEWAKTGKKTFEEIKGLTGTTELALNTSDIQGADTAVRYLNSSLQQMGLKWQESEALLDSWNKTADQFPADTADFAEAYQRSASYAHNLGMDIHDLNSTISMLIESTGRSGDEVGTALRMMFSNLYRPKTEKILNEFGESLYKIGDDGAMLTSQYKEFTDVLDIMSSKFKSLKQAGATADALKLAEGLGEARRRNFAIALLENWGDFGAVRNVSEDSFGYSAKKNELTMESLTKQAAQFKATMQSLAVSMGDAGIVTLAKGFLENGTELLDFFNNMNSAARDLSLVLIGLTIPLIALDKGLKNLNPTGLNPLVSMLDSITSGAGKGNIADRIFSKLSGNSELKALYTEVELTQEIDSALGKLNLQRTVNIAATKGSTAALTTEAGAELINKSITDQLTVSKNMLALTVTAVVAALAIGAYAWITYERHQKEALEADIATVRQMKTDLSTINNLAEEYNKLKAAGESLNEVQLKMAEALPEAADGFDNQGRAIASNIELYKKLTAEKKETMKADAMDLEVKYQTKGMDLQETLKNSKARRDIIQKEMADLYGMNAGQKKNFKIMENTGTGRDPVRFMSYDDYLAKLQKESSKLGQFIKDKTSEFEVYLEGHKLHLYLFDPEGMKEGEVKLLEALGLLKSDYENISTDITEVQDQQATDLQKAMDKVAKSVKGSTVAVARANGKLSTSTKASIDFLRMSIPDLANIETMTVEQITKAINDYIGKDRENTISQYEEANKRLKIKAEETRKAIDLMSAEIKVKQQLLGYGRISGRLTGEEDDPQRRAQISADIANNKQTQKMYVDALSAIEEAKIVTAKNLAGLDESITGDYSETDSKKYEALDKRLNSYDNTVRAVTNSMEILDAQYSKDSDGILYLTKKSELLGKSYKAQSEYIKQLVIERDKLNKSTDSEKISEINDKIAQSTKDMIGARLNSPDLGKARYDKSLTDSERQIKTMNTMYEINVAGLKEGEKSFEAARLKVVLYNETSSRLQNSLSATRDEMTRVNDKIRANREEIKNASPEIATAINSETDALKEYLTELQTKMTDQKKNISELRQDFTSFIGAVLTDAYKKAQEDEIKRIDAATKAETKRHDDLIRDLEDEIQIKERAWAEEDYTDESADREKTISDLRAELNRYAVDDSEWAAKKRKEIQEKLDAALEEQADAQQNHDRELEKQGLQDQIDSENRAHEEFLSSQEEEKLAVQDKYNKLIEDAQGYSNGLFNEYEKSQFNILKFLGEKIPEYQTIADAMAAPFIQAQKDIQSFMGTAEGTNTPVGGTNVQTVPRYKTGGPILQNGLIYADKGEVVFPEKYVNLLDYMSDRISIPSARSFNSSDKEGTISGLEIGSVIHIEHAEFNDKLDYNTLEAQAGIVLKDKLYKQGIKIKR